ncbi:hypothetical protein J4217_01985 [Candidatus Pacearchaeota archaeon]|nr:hypothetical protein [Candidatus Pacearchaeota archaeon]
MKKIIYTLLLVTALTTKTNANPEKLHSKLISGEEIMSKTRALEITRMGEIRIHDETGYFIDIKATEHKKADSKKTEKTLEFRICDSETELTLIDKDANGVGKGDSLLFTHRFPNTDHLEIVVESRGNNNYFIANRIYNGTNDLYRPEPIDMSKMNFFASLYVHWKISPIIKWGQTSYSNLVANIERQQPAGVQYHEFKEALKDFEAIEPIITTTKDKKKTFEICGKYFGAVKKKVLKKDEDN